MLLTFGSLVFVFALLSVEAYLLKKHVKGIRFRIHVNGTRGKSSVTEYIAAGLREEKKTLCKVTGIKPTITYPDDKNEIIKRRGRARVKEQFMMINLASKLSVDALVLECMSILPELQKLESRIFSPHLYIITNIRDDHREEMGDTLEEQAEAICSAIPFNSVVLTTEEIFLPLIKSYAEKRKSIVVYVNKIDEKYAELVPDGVFPINIALALEVCRIAGVDPVISFANIMQEIKKKPQPLIVFKDMGQEISFVDGFAVNDIPSAENFIKYWKNKNGNSRDLIIILNTRNDRPIRSMQFAAWIGTMKNLSKVVLTGTHLPRTKREIIKSGFDKNKILIWNQTQIKNSFESLQMITQNDALVFGLGNIAGDGLLILESLYESVKNYGN
jgi:poly-gamma-glutamate synthase PgsB/CapB